MKTIETSITENQFWQLVGLITAGREMRMKQEALEKAYVEITGDDELSRFSDYVWENGDIINSLKTHLPHDKVTVIWNEKKKEKKS